MGTTEAAVLMLVFVVLFVIMMRGRNEKPAHAVLEEIFGETSTPLPGHKARVWALATLYDAGVDPETDMVYAVKVLRQAEPRLSLLAAKQLVDVVAQY